MTFLNISVSILVAFGMAVLVFIINYQIYFNEIGCFICRSWFNQFKIKRVKETRYNKIKFSFHDKCLKEFLLNPEKYKTARIIKINECINTIENMIRKEEVESSIRKKAIEETQSLSKKLIWTNIQDGKPIEEFGDQK